MEELNQNQAPAQPPVQQYYQQPQAPYPAQPVVEAVYEGPRQVELFTVFAKVFLGLCGGGVGSVVLLLIFLATSSVLQPVLSPVNTTQEQVNPIFIVILMAMIFATSLISSILSPLLLSYTERQRYPKIITSIYQIFIINLVIFAFTAPVYLTTSTSSIEFTAYAAGLQIVLVATAASLIMEIVNDLRYPLLGVYSSLIGILVATAANLFVYQFLKSTTVLLFMALPLTWASIGFFQAALAMIYNWYYMTWGNDFLASTTTYGTEYAGEAEEEEELEAEEKLPEDKKGEDFFKS